MVRARAAVGAVFASLVAAAGVAAGAQPGGATFWSRLEGGDALVASEIGPDLYPWSIEEDGGTGANDASGTPRFVPGRFGNAVTLGPGEYYSMARVHGLVLRGVSGVVGAERGTIAVWYRERQRPVAFQHNLYKLFDGGFGLDSPVQLYNNAEDPLGNLTFALSFGGERNAVNARFEPPLGEWVHVAAVWDRAGIGGSGETARLYVDGVKVGAITTSSWGTTFQGDRADIAGGGDFMEDVFALDDLIIYDNARTDFADRFTEGPVEVERALIIPTAAHLGGVGGSTWRTDVEVHNPGGEPASYEIALLVHDAVNADPVTRACTLLPGTSARHTDILMQEFSFTGKAALRVDVTGGDVIVASQTYNLVGAEDPARAQYAATYGEYVPAIPVEEAITAPREGRLVMLSHTDPTTRTGYRTNVGVVNVGEATIAVEILLFDAAGNYLRSVNRSLPSRGYHQFDGILGPAAGAGLADAYAVVRSTTAGGAFIAYASVIDNRLGSPVLVPAATWPRP